MSESAGKLLKNARKSANMTRSQVYQAVCISESVLERWESGISKPDMEDLHKLELLYHCSGLWYECLQLYSPSFREHFPMPYKKYGLTLSVFNVGQQMEDVLRLQDAMERDVIDGKIDNRLQAQKYMQEIDEVIVALTNCKALLKKET